MEQYASAKDVLSSVKEAVKNSDDEVLARVKDQLVEKEVVARVETVTKALDRLNQLTSEFNKIRPDVVTYSPDGGSQV